MSDVIENAAPSGEIVQTESQNINEAPLQSSEEVPSAEPVLEAPKQPKVDDEFTKKFAALTRKEKQLKFQERQLQQKIADMERKLKEQEEQFKPYQQFKEKIASNPLDALKEVGLDYKRLTDEYILKPEPTEQDKIQQYIKSLEDKLAGIESKLSKQDEDSKKAQEEAQKLQQERAKQNYISGINDFINQNADKYELIKSESAADLVYDVMEERYRIKEQEAQKMGEVLEMSEEEIAALRNEAADLVEKHLLEEVKKFAQAKKIKELLGVQAVPKQEPPKSPAGKTQTLQNNMSQQVPTKSEKSMSDEESKRYIASMIKFNT